jgi:hypothetical protein
MRRFLRRYGISLDTLNILRWQSELLTQTQIENDSLKRGLLEAQQTYRDLAIAWRISLEQPEVDLRDDLDSLIGDLSDHLSVLEEHYA